MSIVKEMIQIRPMVVEDYEQVHSLWMTIKGFKIRSVDDSKDGIARFIRRNPELSCVAVLEDRIVGSILCGHDGRQACFYHVCVEERFRIHGIGDMMVAYCLEQLKKEGICKISLVAFQSNEVGNTFWTKIGWTRRPDENSWEKILDAKNTLMDIE